MMDNENWCDEDEIEQEDTFKETLDYSIDCDGIVDPSYINEFIDCSDLGIFPWGNS